MFLVGATIVGVEGKFWILSFLKTLKANFNDFFLAKRFCFTKKGGRDGGEGGMAPLPHSPSSRTLFTYLQYFHFIYIPVQI